ncbi:DUF6544 family protein [Halomonas sp. C05BenzN]|uniref:DUF6544 family protein n=1 Tax=Halomonas sp. C05BenzN TaxID=3411041 RepID=UPI003B9232D0
MPLLPLFVLVPVLALLGLLVLVALDRRAERREWARLAARQPADPEPFSEDMLDGLPEPARRYFHFVIRPGTPLLPVAEIRMRGRFGLGSRAEPRYQAMEARQILAAPHGFLWAMRTRSGLPLSGSDSCRWTRFRLLGLLPVARLGGDADHALAAYGRQVAEALFWTPAALLPGPGVVWQAVDGETARVTVTRGALSQAVDVSVDAEGCPVRVVFSRWSNANPQRVYRRQPFGGVLSDFREVGGYRLPFRVEAGNQFGTPDYFPFFLAEVTEIRFPGGAP